MTLPFLTRGLLLASGVAALTCAVAVAGAETGRERREVAGFDQVVLRTVGDLYLEQGDSEALIVEAEPSVLPKVTAVVKGGALYIDLTGNVSTQQPLRYHLRVKRLRGIASEASGEISVGRLQTDQLDVLLSGSGTLKVAGLAARRLRVRMTGSTQVSVAGTVHEQLVSMEGSGEYEAQRLSSRIAQVVIGGSGRARVNASEQLAVDISGSGTVTYFGNPDVQQRVRGAGSVERG